MIMVVVYRGYKVNVKLTNTTILGIINATLQIHPGFGYIARVYLWKPTPRVDDSSSDAHSTNRFYLLEYLPGY